MTSHAAVAALMLVALTGAARSADLIGRASIIDGEAAVDREHAGIVTNCVRQFTGIWDQPEALGLKE